MKLPGISTVRTAYDRLFLNSDVSPSGAHLSGHNKGKNYIFEISNKTGMKILEIGSREVTGKSEARSKLSKADYVGFDYYAGHNVDVVGDAHKLSTYFRSDEKFDIIFTLACFEHFAMPWLVATEMAKLLKIGGIAYIETHFSHGAHERPWNFFQFSDMGLKILFSPALGFECIDACLSNPIVGRFSALSDEYLKHTPIKGLYCHSGYLGKKVRDVKDFDWNNVDLDEVVGNTKYPKPKNNH